MISSLVYSKDWKSTQTQNFNIIYQDEYSKEAKETSALAEWTYEELSNRYGVEFEEPLDLVLHKGLVSNGEANVTYHRVQLWLNDWGIPLRGVHPWKSDVVAHELAHIFTLRAASKAPSWLFAMHIAKEAYSNSATRISAGVLVPFLFQPAWWAEGTAQYESMRLGQDRFDSWRKMVIRSAALADDLVPLVEMQQFISTKGERFETGPYTQGFALVRYIAETYGDSVIPKLWKEHSEFKHLSFSSTLESVIAKSAEEIFADFRLKARLDLNTWIENNRFDSQERGNLKKKGAWYASRLRSQNGNLWWLAGGSGFENNLYYASVDSLLKVESDSSWADSLVKKWPAKLEKAILDRGYSISYDSSKGPLLTYPSYKFRDEEGKSHLDLVISDTTGKFEKRLTRFENAFSPEWRPLPRDSEESKKSELYYVRLRDGSTCFELMQVSLDDYFQELGEAKVIAGAKSKGEGQECRNIGQPRFNPTGSKLLYTDKTKRNIDVWVWDVATDEHKKLPSVGNNENIDPSWKDDQTILLSADRNEIFELYSQSIVTGEFKKESSAITGHFQPVFLSSKDSAGSQISKIILSEYQAAGYQLRAIDYDASKKLSMSQDELPMKTMLPSVEFNPLDSIYDLPGLENKDFYSVPKRMVVSPVLLLQEAGTGLKSERSGESYVKAGAALSFVDALEKHQVDLLMLMEIGFDWNPIHDGIRSDASLSWTWNIHPLLTNVIGVSRSNNRGQDTITSEDPQVLPSLRNYAIEYLGVQNYIEWKPLRNPLSLALGAGYQWANFNLYENNFDWTFYKAKGLSLLTSWSKEQGRSVRPNPGFEGSLNANFLDADLFRPGSFSESFKVNAAGVVTPVYNKNQMINSGGSLAWHQPLFAGLQVSAVAEGQGVVYYDGPSDTLDGFFQPSTRLEGYPWLSPKGEDPLLKSYQYGRSSLELFVPLWSNPSSWGSLIQRGVDFVTYSRVLLRNTSNWNNEQWSSNAGVELRVYNQAFYAIPLNLSVGAAWALEDVQGENGWKVEPVYGDSQGLPTEVYFRVDFRVARPGEIRRLWRRAI